MRSKVVEKATVYLDECSPLCVVRDITLESPNSECGEILILGQPVGVFYSYEGDGRYILGDNHLEEIDVFFREDSTHEDWKKHPRHKERNVYWGGCHYCDCEREAKEAELRTRKITHMSLSPGMIVDDAKMRGLVENPQTKEDIVWVAEKLPDDTEVAKKVAYANPMAKDAIWVSDADFQLLVDALPPSRESRAYIDFGDPYEDWGR
jgi:hypothetical protein